MATDFLLYPLIGALAGLSAGMFGVGGGLVIVPALVLCFAARNVADTLVMPLALGTSLAAIVVTAISSTRAHHRLANVDWGHCLALSPGIVVGVVLGANVATDLPAPVLKLAFGAFALLMALQMLINAVPPPSRKVPGQMGLGLSGVVVGFLSALFGIGGGSITVPYLSFCGVRMQRAVGTAAACGLPIAVAGALANISLGWGRPQLPAYSTGFVYWPAFFGVAIFSIPSARVGAHLAQRLTAVKLKRIFATYLLAVAIFFIWGAF